KKYDDIEVQVGSPPIGSGGGITQLGEGNIDIGDASRQVKQKEINQYPNVDFYDNVIAHDGVAVIVSKAIYDAGVTVLTSEQVMKIYEGTITNWKEVGGPDEEINVNERELGSGTRDTFMDALDIDETDADQAWSSNADVKSAVANADNAIGYVGLGYVSNTTPAIKLDGVSPSETTIKAGTYPISRSLHMYTDGKPTGAVKKFIDFIKSDEGQDIVEEKKFIRID
ncbi:MAG: phosphate ABC transporter substrate-binding protein, partial [Thermodesulfobacteriota bacterium]|nr:phosphate ABC transporter substrate-binding protein [Thermodesulfobacteriota bacterium]